MQKSTEVNHRKAASGRKVAAVLLAAAILAFSPVPAPAQGPPSFGPGDLDRLVSRIAPVTEAARAVTESTLRRVRSRAWRHDCFRDCALSLNDAKVTGRA